MLKTEEKGLLRDISGINKSLAMIAKDLHYFRKKDEAASVKEEEKEEPKYTCKDCTMYQRVLIAEPNEMANWCMLHCCTISEEGLEETCDNFERNW